MSKIPFKVAARTARLIGRENVSNAEGAIIELVKNTYDADATLCLLLFEIRFRDAPEAIQSDSFAKLLRNNQHFAQELEACYRLHREKSLFQIKPSLAIAQFEKLRKFFLSKNTILIIDNGKGMTFDTICDHWMTIGSSYKLQNVHSDTGRVLTGEKGIGRFALDRLGDACTMWTVSKESRKAHKWDVRWSDFERENAVLGDVIAELNELSEFSYLDHLKKYASKYPTFAEICRKNDLTNGTMFRISDLRDPWSPDKIIKLYSNLETLTPPLEEDFGIYLHSRDDKAAMGKVSSSICDDFDYKIDAHADESGKVSITIHRNEFDFREIPIELFKQESMTQFPFDKGTFKKGTYELDRTFQELLPGFDDSDRLFEKIGPFSLTIYFMKNSFSSQDKEKFYYKDFFSNKRSKWLSKFAGVKIFRDFFRVRPYGEVETDSFDWLKLGERHIQSPAGPSHKSGQWRVSPNQIAGSTRISRLSNIDFADKSSREGLQENASFSLFQQLIIAVINQLEFDRQHVMRAMDDLYSTEHADTENKQKATILAKRIVRAPESTKRGRKPEELSLAQAVVSYEKEAEETNRELKLLRVLASTGIVISSFAHELRNIRASLFNRTEDLTKSITELVGARKLDSLPSEDNPIILLEDIHNDDIKIRSWLDFSLESIKKDKRTRRKIDLHQYFGGLERSWKTLLSSKNIDFGIPQLHGDSQCYFRGFPMDLDAIFVNLIANSIDAFRRKDAPEKRAITIGLSEDDGRLLITYSDTGPGLYKEISEPNRIFEAFYTTKVDKEGKPIGTGLGMWIVKSTVDEYAGDIRIQKIRPGFSIAIYLPLRKGDGFTHE